MQQMIGSIAWISLPVGQLGGFAPTQLIMLVLAIAMLTILLLKTRKRIRAAQHMPRPAARDQYLELERQTRARQGLEQVMVELDEFSRQIHARLDTKLLRIEAVTREADRRFEALSRLVTAAGGRSSLEVTLDREDPNEKPPRDIDRVRDSGRHEPIYRLADRGRTPVEIAQETGIPTGEVELILALRHTRVKASSDSAAASRPEPVVKG